MTIEEQALALIRGIAGEITSAMNAGSTWREARDAALARHEAGWERDHGRVVAREAWWLLETKIGPTAFLFPEDAERAGLIPPGSVRRRHSSRSKKVGPHWFWLVLQWVANWR